ncbi:MAG: Ig-like domain-containing protein [Prevotella sp.]
MKHNMTYRLTLCLTAIIIALTATATLSSCARMGQPDGGWYDEVPPRVVGADPAERATMVDKQKIRIRFSEYVNIDNPTENIVFCPPQMEAPDIRARGKEVEIQLKDTLKPNTTYTIDFSDAVTDFNESNPMGNYTYVFSTGERIDTLEVSGYVLDAETLEPIKGSLVGLYSNLNDTAFTSLPMERIGRTDASGHFIIRGIAPGKYRVFALADSDGDFKLSQRGERLAFSHDIIEPTSKPDIRQDTTWVDSLHIAGIERVPYTHFLPDDICLRAFEQKLTDRYLIKSERQYPERLQFFFSTPADTLPRLKPLNFNGDNAFIIEASSGKDTLTYWLRDTMLVNQDTLDIELTYAATDSLGNMVERTDTMSMIAKVAYEKRLKDRLEKIDKWEKKKEKAEKKGKPFNEPHPELTALEPKYTIPQGMSPTMNVKLTFDTPLERLDTAAIHLYSKIDTLWYRAPVEITDEGLPPRTYSIRGEWRPGTEYSLEVDSAAFTNIYGKTSKGFKQGLKIESEDVFSSLFVDVTGVENDSVRVIVYLLDNSGNAKYQSDVRDGTAEFYYVQPGIYYISALIDGNGNGKWDTGDYALDHQPEEVFYRTEPVECKEKWDLTTKFDLRQRPLFRQKPQELVKQKAEKKKEVKNQNAKRAADMDIKYDREAVNSKF